MTPADCLRRRFDAYCRRDYPEVYCSYHAEAPFREQFPDVDSYVAFAREQLAEMRIDSWTCTMERRLAADQIECLLDINFDDGGSSRRFLELALLIDTAQGWRYHSAQKLGPQDLPDPVGAVDFRHFDQVMEKVRF